MNLYDILFAKSFGGGGGGGTDIRVQKLTVTRNGKYTAPSRTAYSPVTVNVPQPSGNISITQNGQYDVTDKSTANVNVHPTGGEVFINNNNSVPIDIADYETAVVRVAPNLSFTRTKVTLALTNSVGPALNDLLNFTFTAVGAGFTNNNLYNIIINTTNTRHNNTGTTTYNNALLAGVFLFKALAPYEVSLTSITDNTTGNALSSYDYSLYEVYNQELTKVRSIFVVFYTSSASYEDITFNVTVS